jgi:hypothetical protein
MDGVRRLLLHVVASEPEDSPLRILTSEPGSPGALSVGEPATVKARDIVEVQHLIRVMEGTIRGASRYDPVVDLRIWSPAEAVHAGLTVPIELAADVMRDPSIVDSEGVADALATSGVLGEALVSAFTGNPDRVDVASAHECAFVRIAAAANPLPTQRSYRLASDPCRDVALAALANRAAQDGMTYQFRDPLDVARGFPLVACLCEVATR